MTNDEILEALESGVMTLKKTGKFYRLYGTPTDKLLAALKHRKTWSMQIDERTVGSFLVPFGYRP